MLEFNICKLTSLEYFELPNGKVLVIVASASLKILLSISVIMLRREFFSNTLEEKVACIFNVAIASTKWSQCIFEGILNLCLWRWLSPSHDIIKYLIPLRFWQLNMLLKVGLINFKILFLKILNEVEAMKKKKFVLSNDFIIF